MRAVALREPAAAGLLAVPTGMHSGARCQRQLAARQSWVHPARTQSGVQGCLRSRQIMLQQACIQRAKVCEMESGSLGIAKVNKI